MRSCVETCKKILAIAPDGEFKTELSAFVESVFLELPEDPSEKYWVKAAIIINRHLPLAGQADWVTKVTHIWFDEDEKMSEKEKDELINELKDVRDQLKDQNTALAADVYRLAEVASWAQAVLTAWSISDLPQESPLHKKLREVMIAFRASK